MTIGEIFDCIEQDMCRREEQQSAEKRFADLAVTLFARMTHQIPILMGLVLDGKKNEYPTLESMLPEDVAKEMEKQRLVKEAEAHSAQMSAYANAVRMKLKRKKFYEMQAEAQRRQAEEDKKRKDVT